MTNLLFGRKQLALLLVSSSLLAFQIALLQILATSQWHHFAYLVISVALLGFGVAGTILAMARSWILARESLLLPLLLCACAVSLAGALGFIESLFGGFDSFLLFVNPAEALRLAASALILMLPFACGAMVIGIIFTSGAERIGRYYFANMFGSGIGCILALGGLMSLPPELLPPLCGLMILLAVYPLRHGINRFVFGCALASLVTVIFFIMEPPRLALSQYKDLQKTLELPGAVVVAQKPSSYGQLHVVSAPVLRSATGLSLLWEKDLSPTPAVFVNGDMIGSVPLQPGVENPLNATTSALPFALTSPVKVLVLGAGTGQNAALALEHGGQFIDAVEPHSLLVRVLTRITQDQQETVFNSHRTRWQAEAPRTWLARDSTGYDLIMLPGIGSFGGSAGLFALHEQPLLTKEALKQAWQKLTPNGLLSVTSWIDYPPRNPLRILATLVELLEEVDKNPVEHIVALRSWGTLTFCIKKTPLNTTEIAAARSFAERWAFDTALLPGIKSEEKDRYNKLQDAGLFKRIEEILDKSLREELYHDYPFQIRPASDDRPFFSQFLRWTSINTLLEQYGQRTVPFIELGILVAALAALILSLLAVILVLLPLTKLTGQPGSRLRTFRYFGGLGVGYMWTELALIHRFEFYIGQPVYSASLVVAVLLIGSAIGSLLTEQFRRLQPWRLTAVVCLALAAYALAMGPLLQATIHFSLIVRISLAVGVLIPVAVVMGMPFPLGLRYLNNTSPAEVPWAWGVNGCLSVVGAAFATLIAVETGYSMLLLFAAGAYLFSSLCNFSPRDLPLT